MMYHLCRIKIKEKNISNTWQCPEKKITVGSLSYSLRTVYDLWSQVTAAGMQMNHRDLKNLSYLPIANYNFHVNKFMFLFSMERTSIYQRILVV